MFRKGDEVHYIFDGLIPRLQKGTVQAVYSGPAYRISDTYGKIAAKLVFPQTKEGLQAAKAAFRVRLLEMREYELKRIAEIDEQLDELG